MSFCENRKNVVMVDDDETSISEISIAPNGRIYVFGASYDVLQLLEGLASRDSELGMRMAHLKSLTESPPEQATAAGPVDQESTRPVKHCTSRESQ
jgi:hypothetical protein